MKQMYYLHITALLYLCTGTVHGEVTHNKHNNVEVKKSWITGIIGGEDVPITKHPYILAVLTGDKFHGSAILLNKYWAITAGATVQRYQKSPKNVTLRAGSSSAFTGGKLLTAKTIIVHPKYTGLDWADDLALIKLTKSVKFDKSIKPIAYANELPKNGSQTVVAGYGGQEFAMKTDGKLKEAQVPLVYNDGCKAKYSYLPSTSICTSKEDVGPCPLDWGNPLVYNNKLIGIFSGAEGCGKLEYPAVYADITQYTKWIKDNTKY